MSRAVPEKPLSDGLARTPAPLCKPPLSTGCEWIIDAAGCDPDRLGQPAELESLCSAVVTDLDLNVIGTPQWHKFPEPGGVTGLYLLSESHLACHSFPEHQLLTVNLYCCRERAAWDWPRELSRRLGAEKTIVRRMARGLPLSAEAVSVEDHA